MMLRFFGLMTIATLAASCDVKQPSIGCPVQAFEWSATYKLKGSSTCPLKQGEMIGVQKFSTPSGDEHLSIKPWALAVLDERDSDSGRLPYSLGALPKESDSEGFCNVASLEVAEQHAPADPVHELPAMDVSYKWSNVRVLALPQAPGTQLVADLEYTENGCTAQYEVWAMWPGFVDCEGENGEPDDSLCTSSTSINPDFAVACDPTQLRCVPAKRPPALK